MKEIRDYTLNRGNEAYFRTIHIFFIYFLTSKHIFTCNEKKPSLLLP